MGSHLENRRHRCHRRKAERPSAGRMEGSTPPPGKAAGRGLLRMAGIHPREAPAEIPDGQSGELYLEREGTSLPLLRRRPHPHDEQRGRELTVGRKNWLFSDSPKGAEASAAIYSLVETSKANGLDSGKYLFYVLNEMRGKRFVGSQEILESWMSWSKEARDNCKA